MKDLVGSQFHCLLVVGYAYKTKRGDHIWKCECDCGKRTFASSSNLAGGRKKSCGHLRREWLGHMKKRFFKDAGEPVTGTSIDDALDELEHLGAV